MADDMKLPEGLSEELKDKILKCKDAEEFVQLIKEENIELTPEQLDAVVGGSWWNPWDNLKKIYKSVENIISGGGGSDGGGGIDYPDDMKITSL